MPLKKPHSPKQPEVGQFVRSLRQLTNLTQGQFADQLRVSYETVSRREKGRMQPSPLAFKQLERYVGKRAPWERSDDSLDRLHQDVNK
jgi:putative transcriptional regulator